MNDKEMIEMLIAEYKSLPHKEKGNALPGIKHAICNYNIGRSNGMTVKTFVALADFVGFEVTIQKKQN